MRVPEPLASRHSGPRLRYQSLGSLVCTAETSETGTKMYVGVQILELGEFDILLREGSEPEICTVGEKMKYALSPESAGAT